MVVIYHNPRCSKSRAGLQYLDAKGVEYEMRLYLKEPFLSKEEVAQLVEKTGLEPTELVRKQEEVFKKELKGRNLSREEWCDAIASQPRLLQRPIVVNGSKAVWAQPPEKMDEIL